MEHLPVQARRRGGALHACAGALLAVSYYPILPASLVVKIVNRLPGGGWLTNAAFSRAFARLTGMSYGRFLAGGPPAGLREAVMQKASGMDVDIARLHAIEAFFETPDIRSRIGLMMASMPSSDLPPLEGMVSLVLIIIRRRAAMELA